MPTFADTKNADGNRSARSAAIGPATVQGFSKDLEGQGALARSGRGVVAGTTIMDAQTDTDDLDADLGPDDVEAHMSVFTFLKIVTFCSALYMSTNPWFLFYDPDEQEICPTTVLCATTFVEMGLLTGSRISAGVLFASLTIAIFSKCYATRAFLHNSWLGAVLDFEPTHDIHTYFGFLSLGAAAEHAILHIVRFIYAGNSHLIYETDTGRSGLVGCVLMLPIVLPMKYEWIKRRMSFQTRKYLHMTFLPLMIALCFHSVVFRYVGSILIVWYVVDRLYFTTKQSFLITNPVFEAVGRGTMVTVDLPMGYTFKAGSYIYVNSPTISRSEWHPFSIIQVPGKVPRAAFYVEAVGDWTQDLFSLGLEQPRLPLWITAAQPSIMEKSIYFDNIVLVCTGAGITPAVSIIARFAKRKNIHLLWMSRDGGLVALFEKQLRQVNSKVHLTGKQSEETKTALQRLLRSSNKHRVMRKASLMSLEMSHSSNSKPSRHSTIEEDSDHAIDEMKTAHGDTAVNFQLPAQREAVISDAIGLSTASVRRLRRINSISNKPTDPVTVSFGRPDIGAYLKETFTTQTEMLDESGMDRSSAMIDESKRLDADQKFSKQTLMKADTKAVEAWQQQRGNGANNKANAGSKSPTNAGPSPMSQWLVLYCGANPKVEEAIATTCDELHVNWQKEYFGEW